MDNVIFYDELAEFASRVDPVEREYLKNASIVADQIYDLMDTQGINKTELAERLGTSKAFITKVLRGDANITLKTFTKIVHALKGKINIKVTSQQEDSLLFGLITSASASTHETTRGFYSNIEDFQDVIIVGEDAKSSVTAE